MADDEDLKAGELVTANYGWTKPTVGASDDQWGGYLNSDLDGIDSTVKGVSAVANAAYPASNPAGYITAAAIPAPYVLPTASTTVLGGVKVDGSTISIAGGVISGTAPQGPPVTFGDLPPGSPQVGALWLDSVGGQMYTWYADANSSQWVPTTNQMGGGYLPITGVTDGSDAAPGQIGEFISSNVIAPGVTLATTVNKVITSINLTPGDWDVSAEGWVAVGAALPTLLQLGVSPSGGQPGPSSTTARIIASGGFATGTASVYALKTCRASLSSPATYSLSVNLSFPSGTCTAYGNINARRVR